jgi:hypothetical protein
MAELSLLLYQRRDLTAAENWARGVIRRDLSFSRADGTLPFHLMNCTSAPA